MVRTLLADADAREPQIAQLLDRLGAPVLTSDGERVEVKLYVRQGKTPHRTLAHDMFRYRRLRQDDPGRWTYQELPLSAHGWVLAEGSSQRRLRTQPWGPTN